jgi:uncharacterized repeat protein (TIGR01451 family)
VDESLSQEYSTSIIQTLEGGYLVAGTETDPINIEIIKLDALGKKQWSRIFNYQQDSIQWDDIEPYILSKADGSFILGATSYPNTWAIGGYLTLWHVGSDGALLDSIKLDSMYVQKMHWTADNKILVVANTYGCLSPCNGERSVFIIDSSFQIEKKFTPGKNLSNSNTALDAVEISNNKIVMLGGAAYWNGTRWASSTYLEFLDLEFYTYGFRQLHNVTSHGIPNRGKIIKEDPENVIMGYHDGKDYRIEKYNVPENDIKWAYRVDKDFDGTFTQLKDGGYLAVASNYSSDINMIKLNSSGLLVWNRDIHLTLPDPSFRLNIVNVLQANDGGYVLEGYYLFNENLNGYDIAIIKLDSLGNLNCNLDGYVRADISPDCVAESQEQGLEGWIVEAKGDQLSWYTTTLDDGYYSFELPIGNYQLHFSNPNIPSGIVCHQDTSISLENPKDTITLNIAIQGIEKCPLVSIDAGIPLVRICATNTYTVRYCNFGYSQIDTMVFKIEPSQYMEFIASSMPYDFYDSTYLFTAYNLEPGECRSLYFSVFLDCQTPAGWEHCLKAQIVLDSLCIFSPNSSQDPLSDTDCQTSGMPFDPNDKTATPFGEGLNREIPNDSQINYTIRFQNIGNDTAFQVVIRDTLDDNLAIGSFRPGVSSHDYDWQMTGNGILEFVFSNIQLPDSSIDAVRSQGFVTFSILPRPSLIPGSKIQNVASIYFDYTQPIVTNVVLQTIRKEIVSYEIDTIVCPGEYVNGVIVDSDSSWVQINEGVFTDTLININTMVWPTQDSVFIGDFCQGDINPLSGNPFVEVGVFNETLRFSNQYGCDSIHNYSFTIHPVSNDTVWLEFASGTLYKNIILERDTILVEQDISIFGCSIQLTEIISVLTTGIFEINAENQYSINPNPFSSCFWIQPKSEKNIIKAICLSDLIGQYYFQFDSYDIGPDQDPHCEISDWPPGLYLLQLQDEEGVGVYPILKIK